MATIRSIIAWPLKHAPALLLGMMIGVGIGLYLGVQVGYDLAARDGRMRMPVEP